MSQSPQPAGGFSPAVARILDRNRAFAARAAHRKPLSGRPRLKLAVVSCMDTRLTRMLPQALGLEDGDAVFIKTAGATVVDPYGELMRSLLVAVGELGVTDVMVVGHTDCGTCGMHAEHLLAALERAGADGERIRLAASDPGVVRVLGGFPALEPEVASTVRAVREHPLMPASLRVAGFTINVETGELTAIDA